MSGCFKTLSSCFAKMSSCFECGSIPLSPQSSPKDSPCTTPYDLSRIIQYPPRHQPKRSIAVVHPTPETNETKQVDSAAQRTLPMSPRPRPFAAPHNSILTTEILSGTPEVNTSPSPSPNPISTEERSSPGIFMHSQISEDLQKAIDCTILPEEEFHNLILLDCYRDSYNELEEEDTKNIELMLDLAQKISDLRPTTGKDKPILTEKEFNNLTVLNMYIDRYNELSKKVNNNAKLKEKTLINIKDLSQKLGKEEVV